MRPLPLLHLIFVCATVCLASMSLHAQESEPAASPGGAQAAADENGFQLANGLIDLRLRVIGEAISDLSFTDKLHAATLTIAVPF